MECSSDQVVAVGDRDAYDAAEEALAEMYDAQHRASRELFALECEREAEGERLLSVREAADRLRVNHKTIRARIARGELPVYGPPRAPRVKWSEVVRCFQVRPLSHREPVAERSARGAARPARRPAASRFQVRP